MIHYLTDNPLDRKNRVLLKKDLVNFAFIMFEKANQDSSESNQTLSQNVLNDIFYATSFLDDEVIAHIDQAESVSNAKFVTSLHAIYVSAFYNESLLRGDKYEDYIQTLREENFF